MQDDVMNVTFLRNEWSLHSVGGKLGPTDLTPKKPAYDFVMRIYFELIHVKGDSHRLNSKPYSLNFVSQ
jgi:hypothetical protein